MAFWGDFVKAIRSSVFKNELESGEFKVSAAKKLVNSRTFVTNLSSETPASFDGTENVSLGTAGVLPIARGGTGQTNVHQVRKAIGIEADTITVTIFRESDGMFRGRADATFPAKTGFSKYKYFVTALNPWGYVAHCSVQNNPTSRTVSVSVEADTQGEIMEDSTTQEVNVLCIYGN